MNKQISFTATKEEWDTAEKIAQRAVEMAASNSVVYDKIDGEMDIIATHANGCPLRLDALLSADDFNFAHDVFGIRRHINRRTGQLENCFLPRFAAPQQEAAQAEGTPQ